MSKEQIPSPRVVISARDLKDIIRDELYGARSRLNLGEFELPDERIKEIAKEIVRRALLSPR